MCFCESTLTKKDGMFTTCLPTLSIPNDTIKKSFSKQYMNYEYIKQIGLIHHQSVLAKHSALAVKRIQKYEIRSWYINTQFWQHRGFGNTWYKCMRELPKTAHNIFTGCFWAYFNQLFTKKDLTTLWNKLTLFHLQLWKQLGSIYIYYFTSNYRRRRKR